MGYLLCEVKSEWFIMSHEKCGEERKRELRKFWSGGEHTLTRVFSERVTQKPESFFQFSRMSLNQHTGPIKTHLGRAVGGIFFLISIVYLLSLFISRSLHYLQYMSIEILQFLWCKQSLHSGSLRKEASSEVFTDVKIELYAHRIIIHRAIWLNYLWNYRIWQCTNTGKHFLI